EAGPANRFRAGATVWTGARLARRRYAGEWPHRRRPQTDPGSPAGNDTPGSQGRRRYDGFYYHGQRSGPRKPDHPPGRRSAAAPNSVTDIMRGWNLGAGSEGN